MSLGEAIATARRAGGLTQKDLAGRLGITQAALSRHENDLREPTDRMLEEIATALGVTAELLRKAKRMEGALAAGAHMRRRATARPTVWRRLEAQLNLHRLHSAHLLDEVDLQAELTLPWFDPFDVYPAAAARLLRAGWRLPAGPVRDLVGWMEAAGCLVFDSDFGTRRVDGLSQWGDNPYPVVMLNQALPTDRRRLTLAHELGHLCLHSQGVPDDYEADAAAARLLRAGWRLPAGPVRDLVGWMEAAGCLVFDSDFGTRRVDGLSQWGDNPYPVVMLNQALPTDRRRLTLAHELGHLCLHSQGVPDDYEADAAAFAAEFLMPAEVIRPQLRNLTTGRLHDLKRYWGVSMQALIERGYHLGVVAAKQRTNLYKRFSALGWRTHEPVSDELAPEKPRLVSDIGRAMLDRGLTESEIAAISGYAADKSDNPFLSGGTRLRVV